MPVKFNLSSRDDESTRYSTLKLGLPLGLGFHCLMQSSTTCNKSLVCVWFVYYAASNAWGADYSDLCSRSVSVCQSVSVLRGFAVQTRLNGSGSCLGWTFLETKVTNKDAGRDCARGLDAAFARLLLPLDVVCCSHFVYTKLTLLDAYDTLNS